MLTDNRHWGATAVQSGTNYTLNVIGATKDDVDIDLYGRAYPAIRESVSYYRFTPQEKENANAAE